MKCRRRGSDAKVVARVLALGIDCDLALLAVDDDEFWDGLQGVTLCKSLPRLQESVSVCGFPLGGDTLSVRGFFLALFFLSDSLFFFFSGSPGSRGLRPPRTALDPRRSALRAGVDLEVADQGLDVKKKKTLPGR